MDPINQVLILLYMICNVVLRLSVLQCNFLVTVATMLVKMGMSTTDYQSSNNSHHFLSTQNEIISDMPSSLSSVYSMYPVESICESSCSDMAADVGVQKSTARSASSGTRRVPTPLIPALAPLLPAGCLLPFSIDECDVYPLR